MYLISHLLGNNLTVLKEHLKIFSEHYIYNFKFKKNIGMLIFSHKFLKINDNKVINKDLKLRIHFSEMALTPWLRSPFTDITGNLLTHQYSGRCQKFELDVMECLEAYGKDRGLVKCEALIRDFRECHTREKQTRRTFAMRNERNRQYAAGERSAENLYAPSPKPESF